jgi:hypothetical protein
LLIELNDFTTRLEREKLEPAASARLDKISITQTQVAKRAGTLFFPNE